MADVQESLSKGKIEYYVRYFLETKRVRVAKLSHCKELTDAKVCAMNVTYAGMYCSTRSLFEYMKRCLLCVISLDVVRS